MSRSHRRQIIVGIAAVGALAVAACGGADGDVGNDTASPGAAESPQGDAAEAQEYRFAYAGPEATAQGIAANIFGDALAEECDGSMTLEFFPDAQLGDEPALLEQVRAGSVDFIISATANAAAVAPQSGVLSLHYLVGSPEEAIAVFGDEEVNEAYKKMAEDAVDGAHPLTLFTLPLRNMYGNEEIRSVEDLQGKKVRVQATATEDAIFTAYGAQPVHMPFTEVYTSLQTGVVDLAENALTYYGLNKHHEVAPIMSMTEHAANGQSIWISDQTWDSLSPEQQDCVTAASDAVRTQQPEQAFELQEELQQEYEDLGVRFVTDVDKESFQEISVPMQDQVAQDLGQHAVGILERIRAVTDG